MEKKFVLAKIEQMFYNDNNTICKYCQEKFKKEKITELVTVVGGKDEKDYD